MKSIKLLALTLAISAASAYAQPRLPFVDSLRNNFHIQQCCATTLDKCMKEKPNCSIAPRLNSYLKWMDSTNRYSDAIMAEQLRDRNIMFSDNPQHKIDNAGWPVDGDPNAPVTVTVYFQATCPACKDHYKELYRELTTGKLKGKAKLISKPLGAGNPANLTVMAAAEAGKFSDYMLAIAARPGRLDSTVLNTITDSLKLDKNALIKHRDDPMTKKRIELSDAEATKNRVTHTPMYFINGRRYNSDGGVRWVIDAIELEYENVTRKK